MPSGRRPRWSGPGSAHTFSERPERWPGRGAATASRWRSGTWPGPSRCSSGRGFRPSVSSSLRERGTTGRCSCDLSGQRGHHPAEAAGGPPGGSMGHEPPDHPRPRRPPAGHGGGRDGVPLPSGGGGPLRRAGPGAGGLYLQRHPCAQSGHPGPGRGGGSGGDLWLGAQCSHPSAPRPGRGGGPSQGASL